MSEKAKEYQKVAYYPGCALEGTGHAYNRSTKAGWARLWVLSWMRLKTGTVVARWRLRILIRKSRPISRHESCRIAANMRWGHDVVMAPCNGCYHNLKKAEYDLEHDDASKEVVDKMFKKGASIRNL